MAFNYNDNQKETGVDVTLEISSVDGEIPVTSMSYSEEADTSEVSFNDSYSQDIAVTGVTYSGSFEIAGRNETLRDQLWGSASENDNTNETKSTEIPAYVDGVTVIDGGDPDAGEQAVYQFTKCLITSHSKDAPADDRTTGSYVFTAERLIKNPSTEQNV